MMPCQCNATRPGALDQHHFGTTLARHDAPPTVARRRPPRALWTPRNRRSSRPIPPHRSGTLPTIRRLTRIHSSGLPVRRPLLALARVPVMACVMALAARPSARGARRLTMSCPPLRVLRHPQHPHQPRHLPLRRRRRRRRNPRLPRKNPRSRRCDAPTARPPPRPCGAVTRMGIISAMPAVCTTNFTVRTVLSACEKL